jgi:uncharacterized protein YaaQ
VVEERLEHVLSIIRDNCRSNVESTETKVAASVESSEHSLAHASLLSQPGAERSPLLTLAAPRPATRTCTQVGSAVVFVWDIERFETY